jgi:hypothetical protein
MKVKTKNGIVYYIPNEKITVIHASIYGGFNFYVGHLYLSGTTEEDLDAFLRKEGFVLGKIFFPDKVSNDLGLDVPIENGTPYDYAFHPKRVIWGIIPEEKVKSHLSKSPVVVGVPVMTPDGYITEKIFLSEKEAEKLKKILC